MQEISDRSGSEDINDSEHEDPDFKPVANWNDRSNFEEIVNIVKLANQRVKLLHVLKENNLYPVRVPGTPWSISLTCPFHKGGNERHPAFGYNFVTDRFNCFVCGKSGRAVEFYAYKENKSLEAVARHILYLYDNEDDDDIELDDTQEINKELADFAGFIRNRIKSNVPMNQIDKMTFCLDAYLAAKVARGNINVENLRWCINWIKQLEIE